VAILHKTANLSKTEENNILPLVDITSTTAGSVLRLKDALRNIGYRKGSTKKKEEVVLLQYEDGVQYQETEEEVLYGGGFQNNRGCFNNNRRGFQNSQGNFQNNGFQGNFQNSGFQNTQGNFQKQGQRSFQKNHNKPVGQGIINAIHELPQKDQMELCGNIAKTFMKPPVIITQGAPQTNTNNIGRIYQVDEEDEEEVFIA